MVGVIRGRQTRCAKTLGGLEYRTWGCRVVAQVPAPPFIRLGSLIGLSE